MSALLRVPMDAAYHVVLFLTTVLSPALGGLAAVAAIIAFTVLVRLIVVPLTFRALHGQAAQARLAPHVQRLRQRHAQQPDRLRQELAELYRREGTSPLAGFGPLLVQWPVFSLLYLLFRSPSVAGGPNLLLSRTLFGVPLGRHWLSAAGVLSAQGAVFAAVLAVLAVACWAAARAARRALPATTGGSGLAGPGSATAGAAADAVADGGASRTLAAVGRVAPYLTVVIAAFAPLASVVYLVTSTAWSAAERLAFAARTRRDRQREPVPAVPVPAGPVPARPATARPVAARSGPRGSRPGRPGGRERG
jgi:YidC/Oxa1 family membrane protein insertase